jgi:hypothetical protein
LTEGKKENKSLHRNKFAIIMFLQYEREEENAFLLKETIHSRPKNIIIAKIFFLPPN